MAKDRVDRAEQEAAMLQDHHGPKVRPLAFVLMIPRIAAYSREYGYAITAHGSLQRDLDLVAIPWSPVAADPDILVKAICKIAGGFMLPDEKACIKPHGRLSWIIHLGGGLYIDLAVMPRTEQLPPSDAALTTQPSYDDVFAAYVAGCESAKKHPDVTLHQCDRSAEAYCKLLHATKDPASFTTQGARNN